MALKVRDVCHGDQLAARAIVMQHKTKRPVQLEITQATRVALHVWIKQAKLKSEDSCPSIVATELILLVCHQTLLCSIAIRGEVGMNGAEIANLPLYVRPRTWTNRADHYRTF